MELRLAKIIAVSMLVLAIPNVASASVLEEGGIPFQKEGRSAKEIREREEERARIHYRRQFQRRTSVVGVADTSTFQRELPGWYKVKLLKYRGMVLSRPAMRHYYDACMEVGHYIGGAGYRSHATQAGMGSSLAAPAGYSYHEVGLAADIFGLSSEEQRALEREGFNQLDSEYWHFSYRVYG